jgi:hypothetical protein
VSVAVLCASFSASAAICSGVGNLACGDINDFRRLLIELFETVLLIVVGGEGLAYLLLSGPLALVKDTARINAYYDCGIVFQPKITVQFWQRVICFF